MKALKYWWHRYRNGYPCKEEIYDCMSRIPIEELSLTIWGIGVHYCETNSLKETAADFNITRERLRQILWKIYYRANNVARNV